jgi:hypothetical protein
VCFVIEHFVEQLPIYRMQAIRGFVRLRVPTHDGQHLAQAAEERQRDEQECQKQQTRPEFDLIVQREQTRGRK